MYDLKELLTGLGSFLVFCGVIGIFYRGFKLTSKDKKNDNSSGGSAS